MARRPASPPPRALLECWARGAKTDTPFSRATANRLFPTEQRVDGDVEDFAGLLRLARETEASAREVRRWLEEAVAVAAGFARPCRFCGKPMAGRRDRAYCSTNCRVKAHHRRTCAGSLPDDGSTVTE